MAEPLKLVCIGDSVTQGCKGLEHTPGEHEGHWWKRLIKLKLLRRASHNALGPTQSYRYALWKKFVDAKINVRFVGSCTEGFEGSPIYPDYKGQQFNNVSEGYWGQTTQVVSNKIKEASKTWEADVAIVLLGSNDAEIPAVIGAMNELISTLRENNLRMTIAIGQPFHEWGMYPSLANAYAELATRRYSMQSPILTAKLSSGWVSNPDRKDTCTIDWVHPNKVGDEKIAEAFYNVLHPVLNG